MNVEIGNDAAQFYFWEYLIQIFGRVCLPFTELLYVHFCATYKVCILTHSNVITEWLCIQNII
jgi:hypothetical protein